MGENSEVNRVLHLKRIFYIQREEKRIMQLKGVEIELKLKEMIASTTLSNKSHQSKQYANYIDNVILYY